MTSAVSYYLLANQPHAHTKERNDYVTGGHQTNMIGSEKLSPERLLFHDEVNGRELVANASVNLLPLVSGRWSLGAVWRWHYSIQCSSRINCPNKFLQSKILCRFYHWKRIAVCMSACVLEGFISSKILSVMINHNDNVGQHRIRHSAHLQPELYWQQCDRLKFRTELPQPARHRVDAIWTNGVRRCLDGNHENCNQRLILVLIPIILGH